MPTASIDHWIHVNQRIPQELYALSAAAPLKAGAGSKTVFHGVFVDAPEGAEATETWEVVHSAQYDAEKLERFCTQQNRQSIVENGAIAIAASVLLARNDLRLGNVQKIGSRTDYTLIDSSAKPAGVIEFKGVSSRYTSKAAEGARNQARKSKERPQRIGVVAFEGPEVRLEVVG